MRPSGGYFLVKRILDLVVAAGVLVVALPLAGCAAAWIKLEDGGPVLYRGPRVGLHGRSFRMLKFRSMVVDAAVRGGPSTADDDPRLTRVGRFLRRWKLDELPQFVNVLRGDMSLVGPRPQVAEDVARYSAAERELISVRPGITDWASIRFRNEGVILVGHPDPDAAYDRLVRPQKIVLGLRYIAHRSLGTDLKIIWWTARALVQPAAVDAVLARRLTDEPASVATEAAPPRPRFREITETAGTRADPDQFAMSRLRHSLVAELARDGDLLDVACGSGYALPLIARSARSVAACDRDRANALDAHSALPAALVCVADAERLPFRAGCFDAVACLESIYYFQDWQSFIGRAVRLLRVGGTLIVSWPNSARPAFNPSPASTVYPSVAEVLRVTEQAGCEGTCYGAFPLESLATARLAALDALRRAAVRLRLIPNSLRLRMVIKRVLYRRLTPLSRLTLMPAPSEWLVELPRGADTDFAMLYLVARKTTEMPCP